MFPGNMKDIPDYRLVYNLLQKSQYGISFYGEGLFDEMMELVHAFDSSGYTSRLVYLLRMLEKLHDCRNFKLISGTAYSQANHIPDMKEPVNKVYAYLYNHFKEKVTLGGNSGVCQPEPCGAVPILQAAYGQEHFPLPGRNTD